MPDPEAFDFRELDGGVVAFLGAEGFEGVLQFREAQGWLLHAAGSLAWDAFHQQAYRNFRGERLSPDDVRSRGIPLPAIPEGDGLPPLKNWSDNFRSSLPLKEVPRPIRWRVEAASGAKPAWVVLEEDLYESAQGDGRFLYPVAAFWEEAEAMSLAAMKNTGPTAAHPSHTVKEVKLRIDHGHGVMRAALGIGMFEHYSLDDVVRLLASP
ncbi:MAG: hypothetical protein AAB074_08150 [Planctomycetota bacterium]